MIIAPLTTISSMVASINNFFAHFEEIADGRTSWPLYKRILQYELDYRLFSVFSKMLQFEDPKSLSQVLLGFIESCLKEFMDGEPEAVRIVETINAITDCGASAQQVALTISRANRDLL